MMRATAVCAGLLLVVTGARAAAPDPVLARSGKQSFTLGQLRGVLADLPAAERARVQADPAQLTSLLRNAMLQQMLLSMALQAGWDRRPDVAAEVEQARRAVIVRSFVASRLPAPAPPSDAQVQAAYDANKSRLMQPRRFHLAQIFRAVPANASAAQVESARQRLAALRVKLVQAPGSFADAARAQSDDKRSAAAGGDLGWIGADNLAAPVKDAVAGMQEGSLSDPLRTADGWHLIKLVATRAAGAALPEEARPAIVQALQQQQQQVATRQFLDGALQNNPVRVDEHALQQFVATSGEK